MTHEDQMGHWQNAENGHHQEAVNGNVSPSDSDGSQIVPEVQYVNSRSYPITHAPVDAPLCSNCRQLDLEYFDPSCPGCREILNDPKTSVAQIFACMRQWVPQTQRNIAGLVQQVLKRGANINDRDGLTDMTLLHFACKAGASGVGDASAATKTVKSLLLHGADVNMRCKWTQMSSLHYAAYFDAAPIIQLLLETSSKIDINAICPEYNKGTALHIAAANLCLETAKMLLQCGAKLTIRDALGRTPKDCVPDADEFSPIPQVKETAETLKTLLASYDSHTNLRNCTKSAVQSEPVSGRALLKSMDLNYGSRVLIAGVKTGTLRFCGTTEFAVGLWIGVELDTPDGKNDGSINGVIYFKCTKNHGIFVPINKISKLGSPKFTRKASVRFSSPFTPIKHSRIDLSKVTSKIETGLSVSKSLARTPDGDQQLALGLFKVGERILVAGERKGTIRYYGPTKVSAGLWYGIELDQAEGRNDGSVQGVRYFECPPNRGVFASQSRVSKLLTVSDECLLEQTSSGEGSSSTGIRTLNGSPLPQSIKFGLLKRSTFHASFRFKTPSRSPRKVETQPAFNSAAPNPQRNGSWFAEGVNVLVNNELGVVKYIGPVDFGEGTWLGVELRLPHGKNNGTVNGRQYFCCKPGYGLLVRPHKVSVHGIKGSKLL